MHKSPLAIHEIKLVVQPSPSICYSGGVGQHANSSLYLGQVTPRYYSRRLVVDPNLEPSWTPVNKLDGALGLDGGNSCIDILGDNISPVQHAARHVLAHSRVTFHHLVGWLKASIGDLSYRQLLVEGLDSRYLDRY